MSGISTSPKAIKRGELAIWLLAVLISEFFLPGAGLALSLVLAFTRLRGSRPVTRWGLVAIALLMLAIQLIGLIGASSGLTVHTRVASQL